jgi:two-component system CheB/CheR fusion protein
MSGILIKPMSKKILSTENLTKENKTVPIVAIGASAGGLEAMSQLLENLSPTTGMAFVYIQHLSPTYESHLVEILRRTTVMPVAEAGHQMKIEPNHVYIIPPGKDMEIIGGSLILMQRKPRPSVHLPIDKFFVSLAEKQEDGAIGIVLSGMANDGTLGLKAIKVAGGITFAQDESAQFQNMPNSAIVEGVVDRVLSPAEMASELGRLSGRTAVFTGTADPGDEQDDVPEDADLKAVLAQVKRAVGVDFDHYKISTIRRRVVRRMLLYKLETLRDYSAYIRQNPAEAVTLYNDLLINVTNFFRDNEAMDYLKKKLFPQIIKNKVPGDTIRIWVPACSTGQEAYSLAIILLELLGETTDIGIQIFASDLSEPAITRARLGSYSKSEVSEVSATRLSRFFIKKEDQYVVKKSIRDLCVFAPHNVLRDPPFSRMDLISCRNLLIYLDTVLQQKVMGTFHYALNTEGYLLLGNSETVGTSVSLFAQIDKKQRIYVRKSRDTSKANFETNLRWRVAARLGQTGGPVVSPETDESQPPVRDLDKEVDALLLKQYVPASIVVDQDLEILQFRGSTGLFLEHAPGKASFNLLKMARPSLLFELRNLIHKCRKSGEVTRKSGLEMKVGEEIHHVKIEVVPLRRASDQFLFLVLFEEVIPEVPAQDQSSNFRDDRIKQLEMELSALRKDMHSIIEEQENSNEELQSANEEIVSSNEELQSINEELETSKEEIESTNEELLTINQELTVSNDQLTEAYGYAEAIFSTIGEATLILDKDLRVKSANKAFYKIFHVREENIEGSMFYELDRQQWDIAQLRQLLEEVITNNAHVKAYEVCLHFQDIGEKTMLLHARKVVQHERKEAILLVIEDITEHRRVQRMLQEREAWFHDMIDHAPVLVWVTGDDSRMNFMNKALIEFTGHDTANAEYDFIRYIHEEDQEQYQAVCTRNFIEKQIFNVEYRLRHHGGEYRWVLETAKPMFAPDGKFTGYIGNGTEIHLQKTLSEQLNLHVQERTQELRKINIELEASNNELRKTADRLQSVLNGVPAAIILMEVAGSEEDTPVMDFVTSVYNRQALELSGKTTEDFQQRTLLEASPELRTSGLLDLYLHVLHTGEPVYKEMAGPGAGDDRFYAYFITRQIDKTGVVVTILDISERKAAEIKLINLMESLQAVLDCSPGSISYLKPIYKDTDSGEIEDFRLVVSNQKFASEFHQPLHELVDRLATALYAPDFIEKMKHVLLTGEYSYEEVYIDREKKWLGNSIIRHDHGVVIAGLNITSLKEAEQQQIKWMQQLDESNEMIQSLEKMRQYISHRGEFLRATSHDLRGSFGIIMGATALLNLMDTDEQRARSLEMIQRNLRQVTYMMNQLLDYSRLEAGQERLEISMVDVSDMLFELCESLSPMSRDKGLWIKTEGPDQLVVQGDLVKIRRIAQNLLLNSLKYTKEGGIQVRWGRGENIGEPAGSDQWFLDIEDSGTGMPVSLLSKLTETSEEVKQVMGQSSASTTGEGIGLFIVKRLCELLKAKLLIESTEGKGTLFRILLPFSYG